jgi:hypothetical protein
VTTPTATASADIPIRMVQQEAAPTEAAYSFLNRSAIDRNAMSASLYSLLAASPSEVFGFVPSSAIRAATTRSIAFFHSGYQG